MPTVLFAFTFSRMSGRSFVLLLSFLTAHTVRAEVQTTSSFWEAAAVVMTQGGDVLRHDGVINDVRSAVQCVMWCRATEDCVSATWVTAAPGGGAACYLASSSPARTLTLPAGARGQTFSLTSGET